MIFTIFSRLLSMVMEPPMCRELPKADPLLVGAFTYFALNPSKSQWALSAWRISFTSQRGVNAILTNVMNHIMEVLPGPGPSCLVDGSLIAWINNKHTLYTYNTIVSKIVINNHA